MWPWSCWEDKNRKTSIKLVHEFLWQCSLPAPGEGNTARERIFICLFQSINYMGQKKKLNKGKYRKYTRNVNYMVQVRIQRHLALQVTQQVTYQPVNTSNIILQKQRKYVCTFNTTNMLHFPYILQEQLTHLFNIILKNSITWHMKTCDTQLPPSLLPLRYFLLRFFCRHMFDTWSCYNSWKCERE